MIFGFKRWTGGRCDPARYTEAARWAGIARDALRTLLGHTSSGVGARNSDRAGTRGALRRKDDHDLQHVLGLGASCVKSPLDALVSLKQDSPSHPDGYRAMIRTGMSQPIVLERITISSVTGPFARYPSRRSLRHAGGRSSITSWRFRLSCGLKMETRDRDRGRRDERGWPPGSAFGCESHMRAS
jgi:hypothetical protein